MDPGTGHQDRSGDGGRPVHAGHEEATDELIEIVLDRLGPALVEYRCAVARRAGLDAGELLCLDQLRRFGPTTASKAGEWLDVTRSALSKALRRLEDAGHLRRRVPERRGQQVDVAWRPHTQRDAVLDDMRERVRRDVAAVVVGYRLDQPDRRALVAWWTVQVADLLARHARQIEDAAEYARFVERRRRQRAAAPDPWLRR